METDCAASPRPTLSIVVPVYGCPEALPELCDRLVQTIAQLSLSFEVVLVNDCCPRDSWSVIQKLNSRYPQVKGISLSRNFGQHRAICCGLDNVRGEWIVVMDCDLQDRPEEIPALYRKVQEGYSVVLARRSLRMDTIFKRATSKLFYKTLSYMTGVQQDASIANFGIYHCRVIGAIQQMRETLRYFPTMVQWVGFRSTSIPVEHNCRAYGVSSYNISRLVSLAVDTMVSFSDLPLRMAVKLGLGISFLSLTYVAYIVIRNFLEPRAVLGWASLIASLWLSTGLLLVFLGIIGLYLGRLFTEVKQRPLYIIDSSTDSNR